MGAISSLYIRIKGDAAHFESTMSGVERSLRRQGSKLKAAGSDLTRGLTIPIVGAITAAATFDDTWGRVVEKVVALSPAAGREMREFGRDVSAAIHKVTSSFEKLSPRAQEAYVKLTLIATGLGPLLSTLGASTRCLADFLALAKKTPQVLVAIAGGISAINTAINTGGILTLFAKIGPWAVAIGAAVGATALVIENEKRVARGAKEDARELRELGAALKEAFPELKSNLPELQQWSRELNNILDLSGDIWKALNTPRHPRLSDEYASMYGDLYQMSHEAWSGIRAQAKEMRGKFHMPTDELVNEMKDFGREVRGIASEMTLAMQDFVTNGLYNVSDEIARLCVDGTANFNNFAKALQRDLISMIIRATLLSRILRSLNLGGEYDVTLPAGSEAGPATEPGGGGIGGDMTAFLSGGAGSSAKVVINNYGAPIQGDVSAKVGSGPSGEQVVYLTILGNVKRALRSGALSSEMGLYGARRVGTV